MAVITDYNSLANMVLGMLNRNDPDTIATVDHFIAVSEQNIYRDLRVPTMEVKSEVEIGFDGTNTITSVGVPGNYLETRVVSIPDQNITIRPMAYAELVRKKDYRIPCFPTAFARDANQFHFDRVPAELTTVVFHYYRAFANLAPDNVQNAEDPRPFLTVTSDAWLYGALVEAAVYLGDNRMDFYLSRYNGAVKSLQTSADMLELSGAPLQVSISSDDFYYGPASAPNGLVYV